MNIKSIKVMQLNQPAPSTGTSKSRRPAWSARAEVANPMSKFPDYKRHRSLWLPPWGNVWVKATAEDDTYGLGMCSFGRPVASIIQDHYARHLVGHDALAVEHSWDMMFRMSKPYGTVGLASVAMSGVDLALWDLAGKLQDRPVYELLGGRARDRICVYATGNDTDWQMELGFRAVKLACPHGPADGLAGMAKNEELVAHTRELVGDSVEIMLDCYMAFDVEYTVQLAERLRPYRLKWIEEYLIPEDLCGHVAVRERLPWQTLATGEHMYTPWPFRWLIEQRAVDILQPDVMWCGGLTATLKINAMAEAASIGVIPHGGLNDVFGQHVCHALPNVPWGEFVIGTAPGVPISEGMSRSPGHMAYAEDGYLVPSDAPGFGMEITLEELEALAC